MHRRRLFVMSCALIASLGVVRQARLLAQQETPVPAPDAPPVGTPVALTTAILTDVQQRRVGTATVSEGQDGQVALSARFEAGTLPAGEYRLVLHETGICQASGAVAFASAGGLDPNGPGEAIARIDIAVGESVEIEATVERTAMAGLNDRDGSALVVHLGRDDVDDVLADDRVACGVIYPPAEVTEATPAASPAASPAATPAATTEVTVEMVDIDFNPNEFTIPANTDVTVYLPNHGQIVHNFHIDALDVHSPDVDPGGEATVTINAPAGDYEYYCSIPGHREAGMVGTLHVE